MRVALLGTNPTNIVPWSVTVPEGVSALGSGANESEMNPKTNQIYSGCPAPWHDRPDLVTQALWLLHARGLVLVAAGSKRAWKITATGRLMLAPRRGPARERPVIGGGPHKP